MLLTIRTLSCPPPDDPQSIRAEFDTDGGRIGRSPPCKLILPDPNRHISREHAEIRFRDNAFSIKVVSKVNSVLVNDEVVNPGEAVALRDGDHVLIGEYLLRADIAASRSAGVLERPTPHSVASGNPFDLFDSVAPVTAAPPAVAPPEWFQPPAAEPLRTATDQDRAALDELFKPEDDPAHFADLLKDPAPLAAPAEAPVPVAAPVDRRLDEFLGLDSLAALDAPTDPLRRPGASTDLYHGSVLDRALGPAQPVVPPPPASAPPPFDDDIFSVLEREFGTPGTTGAPAAAAPAMSPAWPTTSAAPPVVAAAPKSEEPQPPSTPQPPTSSPWLDAHAADVFPPDFGDFLQPPHPSGAADVTQEPAPPPTPASAPARMPQPVQPPALAPAPALAAMPALPTGAVPSAPAVSVPASVSTPAAQRASPAPVPAPMPVAPAPAPTSVSGLTAAAPGPAAAMQPANVPHNGGVSAQRLMAVLAESLGLTPDDLDQQDPEQTMRLVGQLLRMSTDGLFRMLEMRSQLKSELHIEDRTMIASRENNPLKHADSAHDAIAYLVDLRQHGNRLFMPPTKAIEDTIWDICAHEMAVMAGTRAALLAALRMFSPEVIEGRIKKTGALENVLPALHKSRLWERFLGMYAELEHEAEDHFDRLLNQEFSKAYSEQSKKLKKKR